MFECVKKTKNRKYCDSCRKEIWKMQKRDWKRKQMGTYEKIRMCVLCKIVLDNSTKTDREYCVNCAILRDKVLHHTSYKRRKTLKTEILLVNK